MKKKGLILLSGLLLSALLVVFLCIKLLHGAFTIASGAINAVLGIVVIAALLLIVLFMFLYAAKQHKK